jgi:hypothetical protein
MGNKLDMATYNVAAVKREWATFLPADFSGSLSQRHAGLPCRTEAFDFAKLYGVDECIIDATLRRGKK